jgi:hypothetical protein
MENREQDLLPTPGVVDTWMLACLRSDSEGRMLGYAM